MILGLGLVLTKLVNHPVSRCKLCSVLDSTQFFISLVLVRDLGPGGIYDRGHQFHH